MIYYIINIDILILSNIVKKDFFTYIIVTIKYVWLILLFILIKLILLWLI